MESPQLPETLRVTRYPQWMAPGLGLLKAVLRGAAAVAPRLRIDVRAYLDVDRVFRVESTKRRFYQDPLTTARYPLAFIASLFNQRVPTRVACPLLVISAKGDPLVPFDYQEKVFELLEAPAKELLCFDLDHHLILNDCVDEVVPRISEKILRMLACENIGLSSTVLPS